jgi:ActR/RegA family two-component response regulator
MTTPYENAVREFRIKFCQQAVQSAGGNVCQAARATGVHRNTLTRMLKAGGSPSPWQLRRERRAAKGGAR